MRHLLEKGFTAISSVLQQGLGWKEPELEASQELTTTVEAIVDGTDSRIRGVTGYHRKLRGCVGTALEYTSEMVNAIPQAIEISSRTFRSDPHVNAFFTNVDDLQKVFSRSSELRAFFEDHDTDSVPETCALLCMEKQEKNILGVYLDEGRLQKDVRQVAVSFSDHQILSPALTEEEARTGLKRCLINGLITNALECIVGHRLNRRGLEERHAVLSARLRRLDHGGGTSHYRNDEQSGEWQDREALRALLADTENQLSRLAILTPEECIHHVETVFKQPDDFVNLRKLSMKLDKTGIVLKHDSARPSNDLDLAEVRVGEQPARVVILARFPRYDLRPMMDMLRQACAFLPH